MKTPIEMARKAGLMAEKSNIAYQHPFFEQQIERFAALVRADEREENARVCEKVAVDVFTQLGREHEPYMKATAEDCAMQIRARGEHMTEKLAAALKRTKEAVAASQAFYGFPHGPVSTPNAGGKRTADLTTIHTCTPPQGNI